MYSQNKVLTTSQFRGRTQHPEWIGKRDVLLLLYGSEKEQAIEAIMSQVGSSTVSEIEME